MDDKFHVVITSVNGKTRGYSFGGRCFKRVSCLVVALVVILGVSGIAGMGFAVHNLSLHGQVASLEENLHVLESSNQEYKKRLALQEKEKEELMQNALAELNRRSKAIESILSTVGVDIHIEESDQNTGGPFTNSMDQQYEHLTLKVD